MKVDMHVGTSVILYLLLASCWSCFCLPSARKQMRKKGFSHSACFGCLALVAISWGKGRKCEKFNRATVPTNNMPWWAHFTLHTGYDVRSFKVNPSNSEIWIRFRCSRLKPILITAPFKYRIEVFSNRAIFEKVGRNYPGKNRLIVEAAVVFI